MELIHETDYEILKAFLDRESRMFNWAKSGEVGRLAFAAGLFDKIVHFSDSREELPLIEKFNYIHIQSLTNMGLIDSELVLTAKHWDSKDSLYLFLPPSPRGGIGFSIKRGR